MIHSRQPERLAEASSMTAKGQRVNMFVVNTYRKTILNYCTIEAKVKTVSTNLIFTLVLKLNALNIVQNDDILRTKLLCVCEDGLA